jgi:ribonucleoside-diphosphate reductase alpha chain
MFPLKIKYKVKEKRMERPLKNPGETTCITTACGKIYITDCTREAFKEIFVNGPGKGGGCPTAFLHAIARIVSFAVRAGVPTERIIQACKGIRCPSPHWDGPNQILSCPDAIAQALEGVKNE